MRFKDKFQLIQTILLLFAVTMLTQCSENDGAVQSETALNSAPYSEQHRPQLHFSPPEMWMNDPNGMFFYDNTYHLFYQHYPEDKVWGPMHWGHATSRDMIHWDNHPIALYPDSLGYIFSGSAVVDHDNTSGFQDGPEAPIVAIYTYHDPVGAENGTIDFQTQGIAYSTDKGMTWTKYDGNPVIANPGIRDFRDPKVTWHEPSQQWILVLAAWDHVKFYTSTNLKDWALVSDFGQDRGTHAGVWECPDLFPLKIEGSEAEKWILIVSINPGGYNGGSATQYFIGSFDGKQFKVDPALADKYEKTEAKPQEGLVFEGFNNGSYGSWSIDGEAFGSSPATGGFDGQNKVSGFSGSGLVNSFLNGDGTTGTLASPEFTIESDYINFLIGGGQHPGKTCINLIVEGNTILSATGNNSEQLDWQNWDVRNHQGKTATIQIVDQETGGWGHILVDEITFAEKPAIGVQENTLWLDYGPDNYAGVTWSDIPENDGRRLFMGWMSNWTYANLVPTDPWRSAMTLPRVLTLRETQQGLKVFSTPVEELNNSRIKNTKLPALDLDEPLILTDQLSFDGSVCELDLTFEAPISDGNALIKIRLFNSEGEAVVIGYEGENNRYYIDRSASGDTSFSGPFSQTAYAPRTSTSNNIQMHLILDVSSVELFADGGETVMTSIHFPSSPLTGVEISATPASIKMTNGNVVDLEGIW